MTNIIQYVLNNLLLNVNTIFPAEIIKVNENTNDYDVQSLINGLDAKKRPITPPIIYNVPASDITGDGAILKMKYIKGDVVLVGACQRDISIIKKMWQRANPNSLRKHSLSDAIIIRGIKCVNEPKIIIELDHEGIRINTNDKPITINSQNIEYTAKETCTIKAKNIILDGDVNAKKDVTIDGKTQAKNDVTVKDKTKIDGDGISNSLQTKIDGLAFMKHVHMVNGVGSDTLPPH